MIDDDAVSPPPSPRYCSSTPIFRSASSFIPLSLVISSLTASSSIIQKLYHSFLSPPHPRHELLLHLHSVDHRVAKPTALALLVAIVPPPLLTLPLPLLAPLQVCHRCRAVHALDAGRVDQLPLKLH